MTVRHHLAHPGYRVTGSRINPLPVRQGFRCSLFNAVQATENGEVGTGIFPALRPALNNVTLPRLVIPLAWGIGYTQNQGRRGKLIPKILYCVGRKPALNTESVPNCTFLRGLLPVAQGTLVRNTLGWALVDPWLVVQLRSTDQGGPAAHTLLLLFY